MIHPHLRVGFLGLFQVTVCFGCCSWTTTQFGPRRAFWPCSDQGFYTQVILKCLSHTMSFIKERELRISWQALTWKGLVVGGYTFSKPGTTLHCHGDRALLNSPQQQKIENTEAREGKYGPRASRDGTSGPGRESIIQKLLATEIQEQDLDSPKTEVVINRTNANNPMWLCVCDRTRLKFNNQ